MFFPVTACTYVTPSAVHTQASATVCSSIGVCGGGGGMLCFIVVLFLQTCVSITTRTVLWPLGATSGCVSYKC